ncbi:MAG: hypothetical protein JXR48_14605 [Candidatus Delongbacteria bacterium]|nr:hypothetical protein [Candidatus Delongbacteria bacterium]MBN2836187.1 hypothetical protein [Candidatus Delongbacteria bacterium]
MTKIIISSKEIINSLLIPLPQKPSKIIESRKRYNRKDKSWKKQLEE